MNPNAWVAVVGLGIVILVHIIVVTVWLVRIDARSSDTVKRLDYFVMTSNHQLSKLTGWMIAAGHGKDRRGHKEIT